jgi:hypothetical protein
MRQAPFGTVIPPHRVLIAAVIAALASTFENVQHELFPSDELAGWMI